jgi:hypothetical protein
MIGRGETLSPPEASERWRRVVSYVMLPAVAVVLGAIASLWASGEAATPVPQDDFVQCPETKARAGCDHAASLPQPARGANVPLRFHWGQPRDLGGPCRSAS